MRKRDAEYHTGRLNISCPPSTKDAIAADATAHGQSISQFMLGMYKASTEAGSSAHLARMGLDTRLRRSLNRAQGPLDPAVQENLACLRRLEDEIDITLRETIAAVKVIKRREEETGT